ncbi:MAG: glycosyltransferase [Burkholderiales bacterium]|nr:glycosyltransferase [Betaproteobacteria bacterium]
MNLLSVVIPTFGRGALLASNLQVYLDALRYAGELTQTSWECIVVDDHSPDGTFDQLQQEFAGVSELRLLQMPANAGPGPTRDVGVAAARGEWVWFLDDDDRLDSAHLQTLLEALQVVTSDVDVVSHSLKHTYPASPAQARRLLAQRVMAYREHQEVFRYVVRRNLLTQYGIHFSRGLHEDIRYVVEMLWRARGAHAMALPLVQKQKTPDAITSRMSTARIDGYLQAYNEIRALLKDTEWGTSRQLQQLLVQTLGVLLLLICREPDENAALAFLDYLREASQGGQSPWAQDIQQLPAFGPLSTNFEYVGAVWRAGTLQPSLSLLASLREVFSTRLSCKDLDTSLFLGPDEIRACCKRFFVNGIRKGDVVLLKADTNIDLPRIQATKQDLIDRINTGSAPECSGCPYIERRAVTQGGIDYLSLENFAYCNMRCTYCSPKYYGGTEAKYNASAIVAEVAEKPDGFDANYHVVWGGGEPTLSPRFESINRSLAAMPQSGKIRVLSNSLKYSPILESQLKDPRFHLVTSIDAGNETTFKALRGKAGLDTVLNNLVRYQQALGDPRRLTVKYILGVGNYASAELQAYAEKLKGSPLRASLFQVSCDFTLDAPEDELICALYELAARLLAQGAAYVFFDDLVRDRVRMNAERAERVKSHLARLGLDAQPVWSAESSPPLVLWGAGKQAQWLVQHTTTGQSGRILATVPGDTEFAELDRKIGSTDKAPEIFPAGVQSLYDIILNIERAGLAGRIARGVLL